MSQNRDAGWALHLPRWDEGLREQPFDPSLNMLPDPPAARLLWWQYCRPEFRGAPFRPSLWPSPPANRERRGAQRTRASLQRRDGAGNFTLWCDRAARASDFPSRDCRPDEDLFLLERRKLDSVGPSRSLWRLGDMCRLLHRRFQFLRSLLRATAAEDNSRSALACVTRVLWHNATYVRRASKIWAAAASACSIVEYLPKLKRMHSDAVFLVKPIASSV